MSSISIICVVLGLCVTSYSHNLYDAEAAGISGQNFAEDTLGCHRKLYSYKVTQADARGKMCWDNLSVYACQGRCDSSEISDYRFPFKRSNHPVCVHYGRNKAVAILRNCEEGASPSAARYEYLEAAECRCQICSSSDTSCEGLRYRPHRSHPNSLGFTNPLF